MFFVFGSVNYLAVLVAGGVAMVLGAFWYSPVLFGNIWMKLVGLNKSDLSKEKSNRAMITSILTSLAEALALAILIVLTRTYSPQKGVYVAFFVAVVLSAAMLSNNTYEQKPLKLWIIHTGYSYF